MINKIKEEKNPKVRAAMLTEEVGKENFDKYKNKVNLEKNGGKLINKRKMAMGAIMSALPQVMGAVSQIAPMLQGNKQQASAPQLGVPQNQESSGGALNTIMGLLGGLTQAEKDQLRGLL